MLFSRFLFTGASLLILTPPTWAQNVYPFPKSFITTTDLANYAAAQDPSKQTSAPNPLPQTPPTFSLPPGYQARSTAPLGISQPAMPVGPASPTVPRLSPPSPSQPIILPHPPEFNQGTSQFFENRWDRRSAIFEARIYGGAPLAPILINQPPEIRQPLVTRAQSAGIPQGKITLEQSRLTPAQFQAWLDRTSGAQER